MTVYLHLHFQGEIQDSDDDLDAYIETGDRSDEIVPYSFRAEKDDETMSVLSNRSIRMKQEETTSSRQTSHVKSERQSPHNSSPSTRTSSPKSSKNLGKIQTSMLRLLSTRALDSSISTFSQPVSPLSCCDNSSISSTDSDGETTVCFSSYIIFTLCVFSILEITLKVA